MTPQVISLSAAGSTAWIPVDYKQNPFNISLAVVLSNTPSLTCKVEYTLDDVFNTSITPTPFNVIGFSSITTNTRGALSTSVRAIRLTVTSWTSGTATLTALQGAINATSGQSAIELLTSHEEAHTHLEIMSSPASMSGQQREVRGQALWTPGDTIYDGAGGTGTGSIAVSTDLADFSGWKITLDPGTPNSKINAQKDITGSAIASTDVVWVKFYVPNWAQGMEGTLYLSSVTNWSKFVFGGWSINQLQEGWNEVPILASSMTASGGETFPLTPLRVRMHVKNNAGAGGSLYIGNISVATGMPMATLCIDDCYSDLIRYAYPIFAKNGLQASLFVVTDWQDQQQSGAMADNTVATWNDLRILNDRGWDVGCHNTGHYNALSYAEVGTIASAATVAVFSGVGTSGDNVINFVSGGDLVFDKPRALAIWTSGNESNKLCTVVGTVLGAPVTELVMLRNASFTCTSTEWNTVDSVTMGTAAAATVTLRAAYNSDDFVASVEASRDRIIAEGMPRAASWFAWPRGEFNKAIRDKLVNAGFSIRGTVETQMGNIFGGNLQRDFPSFSAGGSRTLGDLQTFVGLAQARSAICGLFWHHVNPGSPPINTTPTVLKTEIEWLAGQVYDGALRCPTLTQLENSWL